MTLGQRLCQLRGRAGLSQDALAERLGVSRQSVSKWETDASVLDLDKLVRLSQIFGATLDELVKGTADAPSGSDANNQTEVPSGAKNTPPDMDGAADTLHVPQTAAAAQDTAELLRLHRQKLMGIALMAVALLATALNFALVFLAAPLFIAGVLCLVVRRRLGLAIGWTLWICALFVTRYASAISMSRLLSPGYWQHTSLAAPCWRWCSWQCWRSLSGGPCATHRDLEPAGASGRGCWQRCGCRQCGFSPCPCSSHGLPERLC